MKMKVAIGITYLALHVIGLNAFIIPDELPSILSVIYSNIPTLKKGTDSRIGWGFRLGDRADFQVMVELGPQTNTQPLANQGGDGTNKRNTINNLANTLYAQRQQEKKNELVKKKESSNSEGEEWLATWSKSVTSKEQDNEVIVPLGAKPGIAIGEIDAKSVIPEDSIVEQLEQVKIPMSEPKKQVKKKRVNIDNKRLISILTQDEQPVQQAIVDKIEPLDDVSLE